jgi:AcrR family transcriptional regulator
MSTAGATTSPATPSARARASALPAEERRAAIIAATIPLLVANGGRVTTREIAEAAGIAEGTIFRVFPDKETLVEAAVDAAFDPAPLEAALLEIDPALPFEDRIAAAVDIIERRTSSIWQLMTAIGFSKPPSVRTPPSFAGLVALFEPDRERLSRTPEEAAKLLRALVFGGTHPALSFGDPLTTDEIVAVLLDGIRTHPPAPSATEPAQDA